MTVSDPSGAGGVGSSPFELTIWRPLLNGSGAMFTFTGADALSINFTYGAGGIQFKLNSTDTDPSNNTAITLTLSGLLTPSTASYDFLMKESTLTATGKAVFDVLEPGSALLLIAGCACFGLVWARKRRRFDA